MDSTAVVIAIAGLVTTLLAPVVSARLQRGNAVADRLLGHRIEVYGALLEAAAQWTDNASTWSALPRADLAEPDAAEADAVFAQVLVIGSPEVRAAVRAFKSAVIGFHPLGDRARQLELVAREDGAADSKDAIRARMWAADGADEITSCYDDLLAAVQADVGAA